MDFCLKGIIAEESLCPGIQMLMVVFCFSTKIISSNIKFKELLTNWEYPENDITGASLNMPSFAPEAVVNVFSPDSWPEDARQVAVLFL